jgi:serine/threonine-protein kinase
LKSEHAVKVIDVGTRANGAPYIVMELLEGEDLGAIVERGALSIHDAVDFILQATEAIAEAHALGIVHRDLKPRNLFLTTKLHGRPHVKVLDFGLAKRIDLQDKKLTATTAVMGSPQYMSPEQMKASRNVDFRTDIWSLGVVLYEILTGQMPFAGESGPQLCANVMTTQPLAPQAHRADIPEGLARVILRCLEKERERRFRDVGELSLALKEYGGAEAALAAARVEQIFGRAEAPAPSLTGPNTPEDGWADSVDPIPFVAGVPRPGLGRRVAVGLVLLVATGLAGYALKRAVTPAKLEERTPTVPAPAASPQPSEDAALPPPPSPSAPIKARTPPHRAALPTPRPAELPPTPPVDSAQAPIVYPVLKPIDLPAPSDVTPP